MSRDRISRSAADTGGVGDVRIARGAVPRWTGRGKAGGDWLAESGKKGYTARCRIIIHVDTLIIERCTAMGKLCIAVIEYDETEMRMSN